MYTDKLCMKNSALLTITQAADVFSISENTLNALAYSEQIPYIKIQNISGNIELYFNSAALVNWFKNLTPLININNVKHIKQLKSDVKKQTGSLSILRKFDSQFTEKRKTKGYSLQKVPNKKMGICYYVRYYDKGNVLPRRSTHTNNYDLAVEFAETMREKILSEYYNNKTKKQYRLFNIMRKFYEKDSYYRKTDNRSKPLSDSSRVCYNAAIKSNWIPFLRKKRLQYLHEIDSGIIIDFQNYCTKKGLSSQTVNFNISVIKRIFDYLIYNKYIDLNPTKGIPPLYVGEGCVKVTGCYNIDKMNGIFNRRWENETYYLLCLLSYSTGMRNIEIRQVRVKDIIKIKDCWFIDILDSKTKNGIRKVPLHNFVYNKIKGYINKNKIRHDDLLFNIKSGRKAPKYWFVDAAVMMGKFTNRNEIQLKKENITFYSGRHWWKTAMNAYELGDVEEYFMGHKVTSDVAKRYNHRDKQGHVLIVKKAKDVFRILDILLFKSTKRPLNNKKAAKIKAVNKNFAA